MNRHELKTIIIRAHQYAKGIHPVLADIYIRFGGWRHVYYDLHQHAFFMSRSLRIPNKETYYVGKLEFRRDVNNRAFASFSYPIVKHK